MLSMFSGSLSAALLALTIAMVAIGAVQNPSANAAATGEPPVAATPAS